MTRQKLQGIYLLPNLLTTGALFAGFYSIVMAMTGQFDFAAIAIFAALVLDGVDGRVARLTNTQTEFGAQYDSLSDMVSFGVAPALVIYSWSLKHLGKIGWLVAFIFTAATALRLARFNTQPVEEKKQYFQGMPCPSGASIVASMVWCGSTYQINPVYVAVPTAILTLLAGCCMVSRFRYEAFQKIDFKGRVPFWEILAAVIIIAGVAVAPAIVLFCTFTVYLVSGPITTLWQVKKMRLRHKQKFQNQH